MDNVYVYLTGELPAGIHELVTPCTDGYTVYIDEHLDDNHRLDAYNHALEHIKNRDFDIDNARTVQEMETEAHGLAEEPETAAAPVLGDEFREEILKRIRQRRQKIARQLKKKEKQIKHLEEIGYDFFAAAERQWLEPN